MTVHARQVRFRNHDEIGRFSGVTVFDRCISIDAAGMRPAVASEYAVGVMATRATRLATRARGAAAILTLEASVDDAAVIRLAAGGEADDVSLVAAREDDPRPDLEAARALAAEMALGRQPLYWIALLVDPRADVRALAGERLRALLGPAGLPDAVFAPPEGPAAADLVARAPGLEVHGRAWSWWDANRGRIVHDPARGTFVRRDG